MREIKFRAWNGRAMCYGGFSIHATGSFISNESERALAGFSSEVKPPVMQYTGLKDKNGKEIYEGDIVNGTGQVDYKFEAKPIEFVGGAFTVRGYGLCAGIVEVIGNIHEHTTLLDKR